VMVATYVHLALMNIAATLLEEESAKGVTRLRGQRYVPVAAPIAARQAGAGA
jgi:hypothetical protein